MQYVILIAAEPFQRYALAVCHNPHSYLCGLINASPTAELTILHSIILPNDRAAHDLALALEIRYNKQRHHGIWFDLEIDHVAFIETITGDNYLEMKGMIHRETLAARIVREQLATCNTLLTTITKQTNIVEHLNSTATTD